MSTIKKAAEEYERLYPQASIEQAFIAGAEFKQPPSNIDWIEDWNRMWPTQGELTKHGVYVDYSPRSSLVDVKKRMARFLKQEVWKRINKTRRELPEEELIEHLFVATAHYLTDRRDRNYGFIKKSVKFISDTNGSLLAEWMVKSLNGELTKRGSGEIVF